jgi:inosine/xanthosine triphosphate pyrophosphatase family protein
MKRVDFLTSSLEKLEEIAKLLADLAPSLYTHLIPNPPTRAITDHTLDTVIQDATTALKLHYTGNPCFLDQSAIILDSHCTLCTSATFAAMGEDEFVKRFAGATGRACVVVVYTENGKDVQVFQGELEGRIVAARGTCGIGWDRVWQPDGYCYTLSEMASNKFAITMRYRPYIELAYVLRGNTYQGVFEVHITVDIKNDQSLLEKFKSECAKLGCKAILIELPTGILPQHLMTSSYHRGTLRDVQLEAIQLSQRFIQANFNITRLKIEAMISNSGVPLTDDDAQAHSSENYFEFHIKLLLPPGTEIKNLQALCAQFNAKLSNNTLKVLDSGLSQRFVTLRRYGGGKSSAEQQFQQCIVALQESGYNIASKMREYSVYDTNISLDSGWIDKTSPR